MRVLDRDWMQEYPRELLQSLARVSTDFRVRMYVAGGAVRDWLSGDPTNDLDITVEKDAIASARAFSRELGGRFIVLDQEEDVGRTVWKDYVIDFSSFRQGAATIDDDLSKRDFTINALAVALDPGGEGLVRPRRIIDPAGGVGDLEMGIIRATSPKVFESDPLRLVRAYRFMATLGFSLESCTERIIRDSVELINISASERISHELDQIMESSGAYQAFQSMASCRLLFIIFPELLLGVDLKQPVSHHLDVFHHNLAALGEMEKLIANTGGYFPGMNKLFQGYLRPSGRVRRLKWAALFHDLGKPATWRDQGGRITFYGHDKAGAALFNKIGRRLRWSREETVVISKFISFHMWPFHLNNARLKSGISSRACLRLVRAASHELPGLFLLAMADSLASKGAGRPPDMEEGLYQLFKLVDRTNRESIKPVLDSPALLTGHDLKDTFGLVPGPLYRKILTGLEVARVSKHIRSRDDALAWVKAFLKKGVV